MIWWDGEFQTYFHDVSGTVTVLDSNTLEFKNFNYEGDGPLVYFYLTNDLADADFTLDLDAGKSLSDFSAISVWGEDFNVDFGSAVFAVPEPSSGLLLVSAGICSLFLRKRKS
jgi:hypothetical protein